MAMSTRGSSNQRQNRPPSIPETFGPISTVSGFMLATFTLLQIVLPSSIFQAIGALVVGILTAVLLIRTGKLDMQTASLAIAITILAVALLTIAILAGIPVVGSIAAANGSPLGNVNITLINSKGTRQETNTDKDGQ